MEYGFFAFLSRMKFIRRWGLMRNTRDESLSEHSHEVAVLAHALAMIGNRFFGKSLDADRAAVLAVFIIIVVLIQPGNSNGISALGGNAETFYNKGRGKTIESKLRMLTFISLGLMAIFMLAYFIVQTVWVYN